MADTAPPPLVEVLRAFARQWRSYHDQAKELMRSEDDDVKVGPPLAPFLLEKHWDHPIWSLCRLIEEYTGIGRDTLERVAWRINTSIGLAPHTRTSRPVSNPTDPVDPDLNGLPDAEVASATEWPDLRWVYPKLAECDTNGITTAILRRFDVQHPGVLRAFHFDDNGELRSVIHRQDNSTAILGLPKMLKALTTEDSPLSNDVRQVQAQASADNQPGGSVSNDNRPGEGNLAKCKRSTHKGDADEKLRSALTEWHKYSGEGCLNTEPIGNNELAKHAMVAASSASAFFKKHFKGHDQYQAMCRRNDAGLLASLKLLNGHFPPHLLYGKEPPQRDGAPPRHE